MKATVKNLRKELVTELDKLGFGLEERLDIDFICKIADEIGIEEVRPEDIKVFTHSNPSRPQHTEDGGFFEI